MLVGHCEKSFRGKNNGERSCLRGKHIKLAKHATIQRMEKFKNFSAILESHQVQVPVAVCNLRFKPLELDRSRPLIRCLAVMFGSIQSRENWFE
mmetsp:Transcript_4049/g.6337  ORF Transcript_4049/g.6337 Transcript_4049/m.6337 type:complete len:94 (-) Transcript_4049:679-960(-)